MTEQESAEVLLRGYSCEPCSHTGYVVKSQVHGGYTSNECACLEERKRFNEARAVLGYQPLKDWGEMMLERVQADFVKLKSQFSPDR